MTSEQLQHARAERWRQTSNPLLTSDDASAWLDSIGLCLYLPRHTHFRAPAPSFLEAASGSPTESPARVALEAATALLHSLTSGSQVVPLNLFGEAGGGSSDQPDFLVTRSTLPFVFSMIGGRNWKSGPGAKASPLMQEIWTLLEKDGSHNHGSLTASEIQNALGRELTEAAVLRALVELWRGLRVIPVYEDGSTRWELTQARFAAEMTASQKIAQTTALSLLVALYLESTFAASADDIETFLSPLAPRSRVREVVNGLQATRQIAIISIGAQPLLHVPGSLPEFAEEPPAPAVSAFTQQPHHERPEQPEGFARTRPERRPERKPYDRERKPFQRPFQKSDRFAKRGGDDAKPPHESFREKPWERPRRDDRPESRPRRSEERPSRFERPERSEKPFRDEKRGEKRFSGKKKFGGPKRFGGEKKFGGPKRFGGEKKFGGPKKFGSAKPFAGKKRFPDRGPAEGERPSRDNRSDRSARPYRDDREKRPFFKDRPAKFDGEKPRRFEGEKPRRFEGEKPRRFDERPRRFEGERPRRFESDRPERPSTRPRFGKREGGWQKDSERHNQGFRKDKPSYPGKSKPDFDRTDRPHSGDGKRKPFQKPSRPFGKSEKSGQRFSKSDKPYAKSGKPFGKSSRSFGNDKPRFNKAGKPGKPAFGSRKPGGFKPPFRKRKPEGSGDSE